MRKFLAFVLALFVAIPMLMASFFLISMQSWMFDREFYKKALSGDQIFEAVQAAATLDAEESFIVGGMKFNTQAFDKALFAAIPRAEVKSLVTTMVDSGFDVLEGKTTATNVKLDTDKLAAMLKKNSPAFISTYAESVKEGSSPAFDPKDLSLRPKGMSPSAFKQKLTPIIDAGMTEFGAKLKTEFKIETPNVPRKGMPFKGDIVQGIKVGFAMTLVAAGVILLLGGLLWPKPWAGRFAYLGTVVMVSSVFVILGGIVGGIAVNSQSLVEGARLLGMPLPAQASEISASLRGYVADIVGTVTRGFFLTGIIAASVGAGLLSLRWVAAAREI
jgi:hypothetical protein